MSAITGRVSRRLLLLSKFLASPFSALLEHRSLTFQLAKRDVLGRYRGANFGIFWSLLSPFLMLMVYTFAFGTVLKSRWPQVEAGSAHYSIILFVGILIHGFFAECLTRSPGLIVSNSNYVKRVIFPLSVLPWPMVLSAMFHMGMNVVVFIVLQLILDKHLAWTIGFLPIIVCPLLLLMLGVSWFMAAVGVYFRDIGQITGVLATAMFFLSSAIMPIEVIPKSYRWLFLFNPITFIIDQARDVMLWQKSPNWIGLGVYLVIAAMVAYLGYWFFEKTKRGFADVL